MKEKDYQEEQENDFRKYLQPDERETPQAADDHRSNYDYLRDDTEARKEYDEYMRF